MAWTTGRAFDEGKAVGKMAAALQPSGWWQLWRRRLSARDGSRMLLLLLLLGSGQGPRQVRAGQTFEYLKREHSLSKPYQGEAPGARWSCLGRASGPELVRRGGGGEELHGPEDAAGCGWGHRGLSLCLGATGTKGRGPFTLPPTPELALGVSSRSKPHSRMPLAPGLEEGERRVEQEECGKGRELRPMGVIEGH